MRATTTGALLDVEVGDSAGSEEDRSCNDIAIGLAESTTNEVDTVREIRGAQIPHALRWNASHATTENFAVGSIANTANCSVADTGIVENQSGVDDVCVTLDCVGDVGSKLDFQATDIDLGQLLRLACGGCEE
jgi:hypothetical protein